MSREAAALARLAERAAARAASFLLGGHRPDPASWTAKGHHDYVTAIDQGAEERIRETLLRAEPSSRVMGEEMSPDAMAMDGLVWVVDPLDGTTNFLHGHPMWCVSIGAALDGQLVAGTVFHATAHRRYTAWQGGGAWANGERMRVSTIREPGQALIGTGFPFKHPDMIPTYLPQMAAVLGATAGVRRGGSAALDLVDVALGRFEAFWELMLAPWDMAAGIVLVREAGGVVTNLAGRDIGVEHSGVVAGSPEMAGWLRKRVRDKGDQ